MAARSGRPKSENPKRNDIKVRLDDETTRRLDQFCVVHNLTRAEVIRRGLAKILDNK